MSKFLGVNGIKTTPGSKEENGIAESINAEVRLQLRKLHQATDTRNNWSWYCPIIARNHNLRSNSSTQVPPSEIRFGRWNRASTTATKSHEELLQFAEDNLRKKSARKIRKLHIGEGDPAELKPNRWVWRTNPRESKRLLDDTPWLGPFQITGRAGNTLELQTPKGPELVNISMVKLCRVETHE